MYEVLKRILVYRIKLKNPHLKQYEDPFNNIRIAKHTQTAVNLYEKKNPKTNAYTDLVTN